MRWFKMGEELKRKAAAVLELPGEVVLNLPRVIITGRIQVVVENHRGIVAYDRECVRLLVEAGEIAVSGRDLVLRSILPDEVIVEGEIYGVRFL
ncbi:sporulation protein YqfC [Thermodesulfitimonas autotrophica]|uniref:sporulation protein YqfC n=1 Tax=Thermodesulfitimonas autotrophica TaxID=1894989 RepID=UPI002FE3E17C